MAGYRSAVGPRYNANEVFYRVGDISPGSTAVAVFRKGDMFTQRTIRTRRLIDTPQRQNPMVEVDVLGLDGYSWEVARLGYGTAVRLYETKNEKTRKRGRP